jgi:hypothetical protein
MDMAIPFCFGQTVAEHINLQDQPETALPKADVGGQAKMV